MKPTMTVIVAAKGSPHEPTETWTHEYDVSDELEPDEIGGHLADAVHTAWRNGIDPTDMTIVVSFGPKPKSPFVKS